MNTQRRTTKTRGSHTAVLPLRTPLPALPRWRWLLYLGCGLAIFSLIYANIGGTVPAHFMHWAAWQEADAAAHLAIAGVFSGLIVALIKLFADPVFLGIAQRKSALWIAEELVVSMAKTAVGVAAEGLLSAAASAGAAADGGSASAAGVASGGGGGASGKF